MSLRAPGGYALLLHSQASRDVYSAQKILKDWGRYTRNIILARCHYSTTLLFSTFTSLSLNAIARKSTRMQNQSLARILMLRSFHNLKRQFLLHRFFVLKTCISALKKNAEYSIAFTEMLLLKASRFFFLFYAGKSFRSWATNARSSRAHREGLLRRTILQKFFLPWRSEAAACSHNNQNLKRKSVKAWNAVTLFKRRFKFLINRNTDRRNFELKYHVLSCLYRFISCKRMVITFRYECLFRIISKVFTSWKHIVEDFR
jgi:hypothetical protein